MPVPVHVIAGFLGAGKTTTLLELLRSRPAGERVAVVVNDFGTARIDGETLGDLGVRVAAIEGACVCCTAPGNFTQELGRILDEVRPDRIFVEPTGLARPADLVDTLRRGPHKDRVTLGPVVGVLDPARISGELVREQAEASDVIVLNRTDLADEVALSAAASFLSTLWPGPLKVVRTAFGKVPADVLEWPEGAGPRTHNHDHDHDHASTEGFAAESRAWAPDVVFSRERLERALGELSSRVERAKGLFRTEEGTFLAEIAGGRVHLRASGHRRDSRADLIVAGTSVPGAIWKVLEAAVLREDEKAAVANAVEVVLPDGRRPLLTRAELEALPGGVPDVGALVPKRQGVAASVGALFDAVGAPAGATAVVVAHDGLATPPVPADALRPGLLVHSLAGAPLPADQGGPFRLLIPGDAGPGGPCANVKGVARIVLRG
jgi:G3E family GTPase